MGDQGDCSGKSTHLFLHKTATAARAFARPIGAANEVNWREIGAEKTTHLSLHKAATAARAFARPIGAANEVSWREMNNGAG